MRTLTNELAKSLSRSQDETRDHAENLTRVLGIDSSIEDLIQVAVYLGQFVRLEAGIDDVTVTLEDGSDYGSSEPGRFATIRFAAESPENLRSPLRLALLQRLSEFLAYDVECQIISIPHQERHE